MFSSVTLAAVLTPPLGVELFSPVSSKCCSAESIGILDDLCISCASRCLSAVVTSQICASGPHLAQGDVFSHVSAPPSPRSELLLLTWQSELTTVLSPCLCLSKCGKQKLDTKNKNQSCK